MPSSVDEDFLTGDGLAGVAGEEYRHVGDLPRLYQIGYALGPADEFPGCGPDVFFELALCHHPAG